MHSLLKAMGFWVWALLAIALAAGVANIGYRWANQYRTFLHDIRAQAESDARISSRTSGSLEAPPPTKRVTQAPVSKAAVAPAPLNKVQLVSVVIETQGCAAGYAAATRAIRDGIWAPPLELYRLRAYCAQLAESALLAAQEVHGDAVRSAFDGQNLRELLSGSDYRSQLSVYRLLYLVDAAEPNDEEGFAANLYSRGYYAEAASVYGRILAGNANSAQRAALDLAHDMAAHRAAAQASEVSELAALEHPEPWDVARLASIHYEMGNYVESARLFESIANELPGIGNADDHYVIWAQDLMALDRQPAAAHVLRQMLLLADLNPRIAGAWRSYIERYLPY